MTHDRDQQRVAPSLKPRSRTALVALAFVAFVSLGLPDGVLGVAWPSVRHTFNLPLSQLGVLLTTMMAGYLASSFSSGAVVARLGIGRLLLWSSVLIVLSLGGYALAPAWWLMLACGVLAGLGAGAIDAGINAYAARKFSPRLVNWMHACYGVGATLGPLLMTGVLTAGVSWRWGYAILGVVLAGMAVGFLLTLRLWEDGAAGQNGDGPITIEPTAGVVETLRRQRTWGGITLFFLYTGLEVTAGQWAYSLFTEGRGISPGVAGIAVGAYWASLTAGRVFFGALAARFPAEVLLRIGMTAAPIAAGLIWWNGAGVTGFVGLALLGFALAPVYPLLISLTAERVGRPYAEHTIGFQVSAAYLGAAALPGLTGVLARQMGLEVVGPVLLIGTAALLVLHEWVRRGRAA